MNKKVIAALVASSAFASTGAFADKQTVWYDIDAGSLSKTCWAADAAVDPDGALAAALSAVKVHVSAAALFDVIWHGKNGAVFKIDLAGALTQGSLTFSAAGAAAGAQAATAAVALANAGNPLTGPSASGGSTGAGGALAGGVAAGGAAAGSLNALLSKVSVDAANITEFKGGLLMGGLQGTASGAFVEQMAAVLAQAYAIACADANSILINPPPVCNTSGSLSPEIATAGAEAIAGAIGGSAIGVASIAHYKKLPGNKSTDIISLNTGAVALVGCDAGASASADAN